MKDRFLSMQLKDDVKVTLSKREIEILELIVAGKSNKEIAIILSISINTVKVHIANIFQKLGVNSRTEAISKSLEPSEKIVEKEISIAEKPSIQSNLNGISQSRSIPYIAIPLAYTIIASLLLLLTGSSVSKILGRIQEINTISEQGIGSSWHVIENDNIASHKSALVYYQNKVFFLGGQTAENIEADSKALDILSLEWEQLPRPSISTVDARAIVYGDRIYLIGGRGSNGDPVKFVQIYDPNKNEWTPGVDLPEARSGFALVGFEGKIYVLGGWNGKQVTNSVFSYSQAQKAWRNEPPLNTARQEFATVVLDNRFLIAGGNDGHNKTDTLETWNPYQENAYGNVIDQFIFECDPCVANVISNQVYYISPDNIWSFDPLNMEFKKVRSLRNESILSIGIALLLPNGELIAQGGTNPDGSLNTDVRRLRLVYTIALPYISNQ